MRIEAKPEDADVIKAIEELQAAESRLPYTEGDLQLIAMEQVEQARQRLDLAIKRAKLLGEGDMLVVDEMSEMTEDQWLSLKSRQREEVQTCVTTGFVLSGIKLMQPLMTLMKASIKGLMS